MPSVRITNPRSAYWFWWVPRLLFLGGVASAFALLVSAAITYIRLSKDLPPVPTVEGYRPPTITTFFADDGRLVGELSLERRVVVPLDRMPDHLIQAFLASEDKRFFEHEGVDPVATLRAIWVNYTARRTVQGASTLTQQLCKTLVGKEKSLVRKAREAILARRTERALSKLDILFLYLNQVYLGHGAYGVQAAAQAYFRKNVWALDLAESAMLAGLPPQPGKLNPVLAPQAAAARQRLVLERMVAEGFITSAEARAAERAPLTVYPERRDPSVEYIPYFVEHARREVLARYGYQAAHTQGLKVFLAVDADWQRAGLQALQSGLEALGQRQGYVGALAHLSPESVLDFAARAEAWYGGPQTLDFNRDYLGIVTAVTVDGAEVKVGRLSGRLPLSAMSWAVPFDLKADQNGRVLKDATRALGVGDVIQVKAGPDGTWRLSQEPPVQGALLCVDPKSGYVRAMVGGYDFDQSKYNRAFQGCRQPGSVFKPLVYALALEEDYTLATPLDDTPMAEFDPGSRMIWKPKNYGGGFKGEVLLKDAFARSMNLPAIRVIRHVGAARAAAFAKHLGISTPLHPDLSLVLGASCVYPWDIVQVFGTFALRGQAPRPTFIKRIVDRDGRILEDRTHFSDPWAPTGPKLDGMLRSVFEPRERKLDAATAYLLQVALKAVVDGGTATGAQALGVPAGGKTGTTDAYDAWFIGFSESLVAGVWLGSDRNERKLGRGETGGKVALPVWLSLMKTALEGRPQGDFTAQPPEGVVVVPIDPSTGLATAPGAQARALPFRAGTEPKEQAPPAGAFEGAELPRVEGRF